MIWGMNATVVQNAATVPMKAVNVMLNTPLLTLPVESLLSDSSNEMIENL